jgi:hypothetical protein
MEIESCVPGQTVPASELFLPPDGTFVNAISESGPVVIVRAQDSVGEGVKSALSLKLLMLQSYGLKAKLLRYSEWRKEFEKSAEQGDAYMRAGLARQ